MTRLPKPCAAGRLKFGDWNLTLREIVQTHGPRSIAYMGGGGQGCHFEAALYPLLGA